MKSKLVGVQPTKEVEARKAKIEARPVYVEEKAEEPEIPETGIVNQSVRKTKK